MEIKQIEKIAYTNRFSLSETECGEAMAFFEQREAEALSFPDTEGIDATVYVMPVPACLREDTAEQHYARKDLQTDAPMTDAGYFCVPRVLD